jgi:hypothetical protein
MHWYWRPSQTVVPRASSQTCVNFSLFFENPTSTANRINKIAATITHSITVTLFIFVPFGCLRPQAEQVGRGDIHRLAASRALV